MKTAAVKGRARLAYLRKDTWMRVKDPAALRRARKNKRFTQRDLAFLVRKSQTSIYHLESGRQKTLNEDYALALAARLERPWEELFELEENEATPGVTTGQKHTTQAA